MFDAGVGESEAKDGVTDSPASGMFVLAIAKRLLRFFVPGKIERRDERNEDGIGLEYWECRGAVGEAGEEFAPRTIRIASRTSTPWIDST